jgi:hypothetical protein
MYRGLLKRIAKVWNPRDIQDAGLLRQVLANMQAAERGFRRLDAALDRGGPEALTQILRSLKLQSGPSTVRPFDQKLLCRVPPIGRFLVSV